MKKLQELLLKENYKKIKFKLTKTQHLTIKAEINGVKGEFILDTGASNSCVGFESIELFKLKANNSKTKAAGAGATGMMTQLSGQICMCIQMTAAGSLWELSDVTNRTAPVMRSRQNSRFESVRIYK